MDVVPTVLFSQRSLDDRTNPYSRLLFESFAHNVRIMRFTWKNALWGNYDVFHLQWPEYILREKHLVLRLLNFVLCYGLVARLRLQRIPVVETVHNLKPHDHASFLERKPLKALRRLVRHNIYLNRSTENNTEKGSVILHGHYLDVLRDLESRDSATRGSYFLFFGLIRPYKGMEKLVSAFTKYHGPIQELVIAGLPTSPEYGDRLKQLVDADQRIVLDLRHLPEDELFNLVTHAAAVILPYEYMYNSGALIYSLSAATPVLAPASPANRAIQAEVGADWLVTFDESIRPEDFDRVPLSLENPCPSRSPDLSQRDWAGVAKQHLSLYRRFTLNRTNAG